MSLATLIQASAHSLPMLPDASVHLICTSPPYYGLRKYDGEQGIKWPTVEYSPMAGLPPIRIQGCEEGCAHEWGEGRLLTRDRQHMDELSRRLDNGTSPKSSNSNERYTARQGEHCQLCGGWRGPLGLEPTPEAYIGHLILCLREWRRVLRPDGVCFVNLGDSYMPHNGSRGNKDAPGGDTRKGRDNEYQPAPQIRASLKTKDLMMIPARFALAAQADGWYLRSEIIWAKGVSLCPDYAGSCMTESVQDRPTKAHEYIYMLARSERYFWDIEAVKERAVRAGDVQTFGGRKARENAILPSDPRYRQGSETWGRTHIQAETRNLRTVWAITPRPYTGAHFAAWPPELVEPMIAAGTSERGVCASCGTPWKRKYKILFGFDDGGLCLVCRLPQHKHDQGEEGAIPCRKKIPIGWQPSCKHDGPTIPAIVLDPFSGSGTTGQVAVRLRRRYIGVDLAASYLDDLTPERLTVQMELF